MPRPAAYDPKRSFAFELSISIGKQGEDLRIEFMFAPYHVTTRYADFEFETYADPVGDDRGADRRDDAGRDPDLAQHPARATPTNDPIPLREAVTMGTGLTIS